MSQALTSRLAGSLRERGLSAKRLAVPAFAEAMDDDFGVPQALAVVHTTVRQGNAALSADDKEAATAGLAGVRAMRRVLGLDPLDEQ